MTVPPFSWVCFSHPPSIALAVVDALVGICDGLFDASVVDAYSGEALRSISFDPCHAFCVTAARLLRSRNLYMHQRFSMSVSVFAFAMLAGACSSPSTI